jgi:protein involved in polysaccharide export with SLBB domain
VKNTVEVRGAVNAPTIMAVSRGASLEFYIRAAGGGSTTADAGRSYVVQPNGKIEIRRHFWFWNFDPTPRPGATVTVPARDSTNTAAATLQTFSTLTQILATVLTAAALLKR